MKHILLFIGIIWVCISNVQSQSWISSNTIRSTENIVPMYSAITSDGSVITYGFFEGTLNASTGEQITSYGGRDYYLIKFTPEGAVDWMRQLGSTMNDFVSGHISVADNDDIFVTGSFMSWLKYSETDSIQSSGLFDVFLTKYTSNGDVIWCKNVGMGPSMHIGVTVSAIENTEVLISGQFKDSIMIDETTILYADNSSMNLYFAKLDATDGSVLWAKILKTAGPSASAIIMDYDITENEYVFTGIFKDSLILDNDTLVSTNLSQDVFIFKTDLGGNVNWSRRVQGDKFEYCYNIKTDTENNIYISGYYNSETIYFDKDNLLLDSAKNISSDYDVFICKYLSNGDLSWKRSLGGKLKDQAFRSEFHNNEFIISGSFVDTLMWGGIELTSNGSADTDMFVGSIDSNGNYRSANSYSGINNSVEEGRSVFINGENLYTIMRSNSEVLILGDSVYSSDGSYFIALGIIGCLPISIDNTIYTDVTGCFGDSTGAIQISASGGFGSPWQYSIDNGLSYQESPYFPQLPIGDYQVLVIDKENCTEVGQVVTLAQPDTLEVQLISSSDITVDANGSIVVGAQGGTSPYTYTLMPDNVLQGFGTFMFARGDSGRYVVQLNDGNLCGPVSTDTIWIQDLSSVGINDLGGLMLRVFPNPATDVVTVEMPMEAAEVSMEVVSLTGQVVLRRQAYTTGGVLRETIDVSELADGMYMLRLNGETLKSAFVVN